jgi:hypothetical protein
MMTRSLVGCSAGMAVDAAPYESPRNYHQKPRVQALVPAQPEDVLPANTCRRCGIRGRHPGASECIAALRDRLSRFE